MTDTPGKKDRRAAVLAAARACLTQYGFGKMTMDDVGERVGLNKASLYYYFPNKEALVAAVICSESQEYVEGLQKTIEAATGCEQQITGYLAERYRIYERVLNLHRLTMQDLRQMGPTLKAAYRDCKEREAHFLRALLDGGVARGEMAACDTARVAGSILAVADGYKMEAIGNPDLPPGAPIDYAVIGEAVVFTVSLMLRGLRRTD